MQAIATAIGYVLGKFVAWARFFLDVVIQLFLDAWEFVTDSFVWVFDQVLGVVQTAIEAVDVSGVNGYSSTWTALPGQVLEVTSALGLGQALGVVGAAITIRLGLQLIPFTRLGS